MEVQPIGSSRLLPTWRAGGVHESLFSLAERLALLRVMSFPHLLILDEPTDAVTVAGRYCDAGDVLIEDVVLPPIVAGDLLAIPASGAYCPSLASNYNLSLRPPIVLVKDGQARLIRRRERYEDLVGRDV